MGAQDFGTGSRERIPYGPEGRAASGLSSCVGLRVVRGMVRSGNEDASLGKPGTQTYKQAPQHITEDKSQRYSVLP